ncbi:hypothetical protein K438DRAFT_1978857 [Mycena galopus ATCC 62051]|nr:hypothetical protein K438DRAFT_1978857 [Mycena galopus ATCC 62051]
MEGSPNFRHVPSSECPASLQRFPSVSRPISTPSARPAIFPDANNTWKASAVSAASRPASNPASLPSANAVLLASPAGLFFFPFAVSTRSSSTISTASAAIFPISYAVFQSCRIAAVLFPSFVYVVKAAWNSFSVSPIARLFADIVFRVFSSGQIGPAEQKW